MSLKEIERPLGQSISAPRERRLKLGLKPLLAGATALAVVAVSGVIALRDQPFRKPAVTAVATPEVVAPVPAADQSAEPQPQQSVAAAVEPGGSGGAKIIRVNPPETTGSIVIQDPSTLGQDLRVAHLPDRALLEDSEFGPLPVRAADGRRPFDVYARPWSGARGARVAIVIGGLAVSQTGTQEAIAKLPAEVTLAFASGGNSIGRWMQAARQAGHEVVMQLPLEPFDYPNVNPGRNTLTVSASGEENIDHLRWVLGRTTNYTGVMNYMGARFSADPKAMAPVMAELGKRGLLYLDDGSSARTAAPGLAEKNGVPFAAGDTVIDGVQDRGEILKKLDQLEATARAKGFAIGTGSAFGTTVDAVSAWVNEAKKRGIEIVPVSALATDPEK